MPAISTYTLAQTIEWAKRFNFNRVPVLNLLEPAITSANLVLQTILNPPFIWWWNKQTLNFTCSPTVQDYIVPVSGGNFGFIESASISDITVIPNKFFELEEKNYLSLASEQARPRFIAPHSEDAQGNMTFRVMPNPIASYPVTIYVQNAPTLFTSTNQTWAPIPDYLGNIYNWGFLALMFMFSDDNRFAFANQKFVSSLLGAAEGLDEVQRNIFIHNWGGLTGAQQQRIAQGIQERGV